MCIRDRHITSKCELTSRYLSINIGDRITPDEARGGINKNASLSVVCNAPANILFSIRAADMQDGQINKTKCGPGYCTLSFDNDKSPVSYTHLGVVIVWCQCHQFTGRLIHLAEQFFDV